MSAPSWSLRPLPDAPPHAAAPPDAAVPLADTWARLLRLRGPGERAALLLALLLTPGSRPEQRAWAHETRGLHRAADVLAVAEALPPAARLPALEWLLRWGAAASLPERQSNLAAVRRLMCADGRVRPLDRLLLLLVRHQLQQDTPPQLGRVRVHPDLPALPLALRQAIATVSAYLARLVPQPDDSARVGVEGARWYAAVMAECWGITSPAPDCHVPDGAELVQALQALQGLGWMHRPLLARAWTEAVPPGALSLTGAEALRIACGLLDTPLPLALQQPFLSPPDPA